ncbi:MAG: UbiA family prenyltransferase [Planctomycetota bacterium]
MSRTPHQGGARGFLALLRLTRFPNALTTIADLAAGVAVGIAAGGRAPSFGDAVLQSIGLVTLYMFGMGLNDWVDRAKDARLHPTRPLPSGDLGENAALATVIGTLGFGLAVGLSLGGASAATTVGLVLAILAYDLAARGHGPWGALAMGSCRALAMGLGVTLAGAPASLDALAPPLAYGAAVAALTWVSLWEDRRPSAGERRVGLAVFATAWIATVATSPRFGFAALAVALLVVLVTAPARRHPPIWGLVVRNAVFALPLLDAVVAAAHEDLGRAGLAVIAFIAARLAARTIGRRGS